MTPPSPTTDADFEKHLAGTVCLRSGKWVAKIRHPIRKVWVCVGIYNNHEEAADTYARKKLEYESHSVQDTAASFYTNVTDFEKHLGVKRMTSGKWGACIKHKKVTVWLGSYNTFNEAADAYDMSKLELQSPKAHSLTKAGGSVDLDSLFEAAEAPNQKKCEVGLKDGAEQTERNQRQRHAFVSRSGRWRTEISHPIKKAKKICLGTFDTAEEAEDTYNSMMRQFDVNHQQSNEGVYSGTLTEEAEEAYNNKMREVDLMVRDHENCKLDSGFGSSSLKDGITQAVSSPFGSAHIREVGRRGSVYQVKKSGKWKAEIQIRNVKHKLGTYATAEDAQEALNKKKCELGLKGEDVEEAVNRKKCELGLNGDAEQSERNQRRCHAYLRKSGRWETEIIHPMKKRKKIYLGTFDSAEEAEDAYNRTRHQFELMFPGYMKRNESNERIHSRTLTEEAEEAYNSKMCEVDLIVCAHKKPKQLKGICEADLIVEGKSDSTCISDDPFVSADGSSVIKAGREEDGGGRIINVNVESVPEFDLGVIDSCGRLVGEYSKIDDELWIG